MIISAKNNQDWAAAAVAHMGKPTAISSVGQAYKHCA